MNAQRADWLIKELGNKVAPRTVATYIEPLRFAVSWAYKKGHIPDTPLRGAGMVKVAKRAQSILTPDDIDAIIQRAKEARTQYIYLPILLAIYVGLRKSEIGALTPQKINFSTSEILIDQARVRAPDGKVTLKAPKSAASRRTVAMPDEVMAEIKNAARVKCRTIF